MNLFSTSPLQKDFSSVSSTIPHMVSDSQNLALYKMPNFDEIREVIFDLDPYSAPSPDGFIGLFFWNCWHTVGRNICDAVCSFFLQMV